MHIFCIHDIDLRYNIDDKCIDLVAQLLECVGAKKILFYVFAEPGAKRCWHNINWT